MRIKKESDYSTALNNQENYLSKVKQTISKHLEADQQLAREKLTQNRLKKKRRLRGDRGQNADDDEAGEEYVVTLGGSGQEDNED